MDPAQIILAIDVLIKIIIRLSENARFKDDLQKLRDDLDVTKGVLHHIQEKKPKNPNISNWTKNISNVVDDCETFLKTVKASNGVDINPSKSMGCLGFSQIKKKNKLHKLMKRLNNLARHQDVILQLCNNERRLSFTSRLANFIRKKLGIHRQSSRT